MGSLRLVTITLLLASPAFALREHAVTHGVVEMPRL